MIAARGIHDIGLTPVVIAGAVALMIGAFGLLAAISAGLAVAIVGPRRLDAVTLPAIAVGAVTVPLVFLGRLGVAAMPGLIVVAIVVAFAAALLQRRSLELGGERLAVGAYAVGRVAAWVLVGAAVGAVVGAAMLSVLPLLLFPLIGLLIALRTIVPRPSDQAAPPAGAPPTDAAPPATDVDARPDPRAG